MREDEYGQLLAEVGESLRDVRELDGWSVAELAVIAGLEESEIRAIEAGETGFDTETLGKWLSALGFVRGLSDEVTGQVEETDDSEVRYRNAPHWMTRLKDRNSANAGSEGS